jgi:hypothetical protein
VRRGCVRATLSVGRDALASQKELFTIISFNDASFPIHIEVKLSAPPAVGQPSVVSFHLSPAGAVLIAAVISSPTGS